MNYIVIEEEAVSQLNKVVNECIRDGFRPQGGVVVVNKENGNTYYIQTMLRKELMAPIPLPVR